MSVEVEILVEGDDQVLLTVEGPVTINTSTGAQSYLFTQATPSSSWTVNHNLGRSVVGQAFDNAGNLLGCDAVEISNNTYQFNFLAPVVGRANIS